MKETKYRFEYFHFYDYTRIQEHLAAMAAKGWMLEKMGFFWKYRRIQPQKRKFCVTYYANASLYDAQPTEGECTMEDFCAAGGWKLAARREQMQIYYTEQENAVPMETDPVTRIETVDRAVRKKLKPNTILVTCMLLYWLVFYTSQFWSDPIQFLSSPMNITAAISMLMLFPCLIRQNVRYRSWYRRAMEAAQQGEFSDSQGEDPLLLYMIWPLLVLLFTFTLVHMGTGMFIVGLSIFLVVGISVIAEGIRRYLQKKGASRSVNATVTAIGCGLACIGILATGAILVIQGDIFLQSHKQVGTYTQGNWTRPVYADPIPLRLEDMAENLPADMLYSTEENGEESFLLSDKEYWQNPMTEEDTPSPIYYRVVKVKVPALYNLCKNSLLKEEQDEWTDGTLWQVSHYEPIDTQPWGAQDAYRLYFGERGWGNEYLVCWKDTMLVLLPDEEPTDAEKLVIAQKVTQ